MINILIFAIGAVAGFLVAWVWLSQKMKAVRLEAGRVEREIKAEREVWYGFSAFNEKMGALKKI